MAEIELPHQPQFPSTPLFENVDMNRAVDDLMEKYAFVRTLHEKYGNSEGLARDEFRALFVSTFKEDFSEPTACEFIELVNLIGTSKISKGIENSYNDVLSLTSDRCALLLLLLRRF